MKKNKQKGFTLVEVVITLSITFIVLFMIATLSFSISNIVQLQNANAKCMSEYFDFKQNIESFCACYSIKDFKIKETINSDDLSKIIITNSFDEYILIFNNDSQELTYEILDFQKNVASSIVKKFETICGVNFLLDNSIVKCKVNMINKTSYVFLFKLEV